MRNTSSRNNPNTTNLMVERKKEKVLMVKMKCVCFREDYGNEKGWEFAGEGNEIVEREGERKKERSERERKKKETIVVE